MEDQVGLMVLALGQWADTLKYYIGLLNHDVETMLSAIEYLRSYELCRPI